MGRRLHSRTPRAAICQAIQLQFLVLDQPCKAVRCKYSFVIVVCGTARSWAPCPPTRSRQADMSSNGNISGNGKRGRRLAHTRTITCRGYELADGLWEVELRLTDVKPDDLVLRSGIRFGGMPIHDMAVRVIFDESMFVREVIATTVGSPYPGTCGNVTPAYEALTGINLMRGFRQMVKQAIPVESGCTHLTELLALAPTTAVQTLVEARKDRKAGEMPYEIGRCHALSSSGAIVQKHYPHWFIAQEK
ncbi:DUF2889 domain-containing protein [Paraburkholderia xenovorans]